MTTRSDSPAAELATNALGIDLSPPQTASPSIPLETDPPRQCSFRWAGKSYGPLLFAESDCIGDLKEKIWSLINVPPARQKILGLGKLPEDHISIASLDSAFKGGKSKEFMVLGTPIGEEAMGSAAEEGSPEVDYSPDQIQAFKAQQSIRNQYAILGFSLLRARTDSR